MTKIVLLFTILFLLSACVNKHGVSTKYYSDCDEYYDLQGFYHKKCGEDDMFTYDSVSEAAEYILGEDKKNKGNVWK